MAYTYRDIVKKAEEFGIPKKIAIARRIVTLEQMKEAMMQDIREMADHISDEGANGDVALSIIKTCVYEIDWIDREIKWIRKCENGLAISRERFTVDELADANRYPMTSLIAFTDGKAIAPCHEDSRPSLTYWAKGNKATCWPCNKSWRPIDWCIEQMGMKFPEAVHFLLGR